MKKFLLSLATVAMAGSVWATDDISIVMSKEGWSPALPSTASSTATKHVKDGVEITISNVKYTSLGSANKGTLTEAVIVTKGTGYIALPDFAEPIQSVTLYSHKGASISGVIQITGSEEQDTPSIALTKADLTTPYEYTFSKPVAANTQLTLKATSAANVQISKIVISFATNDDRADAGLSFPESEYNVNLGDTFTAPELTKATTAEVVYTSSNPEVATVDAATGAVKLVAAGKTTITATSEANDTYKAGKAEYTLFVIDPDALEATFDFAKDITGTSFKSGIVTADFAKADGSTDPAWYEPEMRLYAKNTLTISVPEGYYLTSIEFTTASSNGKFLEGASVNNGNFNSTNKTWAPNAGEKATSVTLTNGTVSKGHTRIQKIIVKYGKDTGTAVESVEIDANAPKEYYNLQGVRVANPEKGLYIVRQGGKVSKVIL